MGSVPVTVHEDLTRKLREVLDTEHAVVVSLNKLVGYAALFPFPEGELDSLWLGETEQEALLEITEVVGPEYGPEQRRAD